MLAKKSVLAVIFVLFSLISRGQNWMMAQKYLTLSVDSLIRINYPNTGKLISSDISHIEYDDIIEDFSIAFTYKIICSKLDIPFKTGDDQDIVFESGKLHVSLAGGLATYEDESGEETEIELPDLSGDIYLFNETNREISFSVTFDDKDSDIRTVLPDQFKTIQCLKSGYAYIAIITIPEPGQRKDINYKLEKAKGYRLKYDNVSSKYEVYPDERIDNGY